MDYQQYEQIEKNLRYIASMRPVFNKRALFFRYDGRLYFSTGAGTFFQK